MVLAGSNSFHIVLQDWFWLVLVGSEQTNKSTEEEKCVSLISWRLRRKWSRFLIGHL